MNSLALIAPTFVYFHSPPSLSFLRYTKHANNFNLRALECMDRLTARCLLTLVGQDHMDAWPRLTNFLNHVPAGLLSGLRDHKGTLKLSLQKNFDPGRGRRRF